MRFSELAYYDVAVSLGEFVTEKSDESQTVTYKYPMENISRYSGGGGVVQTTYFRNIRAAYQSMLRDPHRQQIEGFGQWEFLGLLGVTLGGEAREVHNSFMDEWSFEDRNNSNYRRAKRAERCRVLWRAHRRDRAAFMTLRSNSGFATEPVPPTIREPHDLEDFIFDLQERFRSSTTENLSAIHGFRPHTNEGLERMFARFNLIAKPLEEEKPSVITIDQLRTHYIHHLEAIMTAEDFTDLERQIRDADRERATQGRKSIGRHHIHELALQQDREKVFRQTKLRAAGFLPPIKVPIKDRMGKFVPDVPRENNQDKNSGADV